ncbi:hypothetical protein [Amycolatopsis sp. NPDC003731]
MSDKNRRAALDAAVALSDIGDEPAEVIKRAEKYLAWLEPPALAVKPRTLTATNAFTPGRPSAAQKAWTTRGAAKTVDSAFTAALLAFDETHLFDPGAHPNLFKPGASFDEWIYCGPPLKPGSFGKPADPPERVIPLLKRDPETGADVDPKKYVYFRGRGRLYRVVSGDGPEAPAEYWFASSRKWSSAAIWSKYSDLRDSGQFRVVRF